MMPINLTLSAFGPYPKVITIDFESFQEDGLFLITGPTGSGKTMIFDAMMFALYGKTSGQIRQIDSLRCDHAENEQPTYVEFSLTEVCPTIPPILSFPPFTLISPLLMVLATLTPLLATTNPTIPPTAPDVPLL